VIGCLVLLLLPQLPDKLADAMRLAAAGDLERAEALLGRLRREHPGDAEVRYRLGLVLLRQKKYPQAAAELEEASRLAPDLPQVWLAVAQARLESGQREGALQAAARAAELGSNQPVVRRGLAMFYRQAKDPARAVDEWQEVIRLDPAQPGAYLELAKLFLDHRTPEPAVVVLEQAAQSFPQDTEVVRLLGIAHYGTGNTQKALDAFLRTIDLAPDEESGYSSLETLLPEVGRRRGEVVQRLQGYCERRPASPLGWHLLALVEGGREDLLRRAVEVDPNFWPAWFELHKPLLAADKLDEAARALEKTVALHPDHAAAHYGLAQVYARLGDREKALAARRRHHDLVTKEREAAEARRRQAPMLPYRLREP
jgi:predicted Zn-dependent protease